MRNKIALYGAGNIGAAIAQLLAPKELADISLFDISGTLAEGKALDLQQSAALSNFNTKITGSNDAAIIEDADVVVISAGVPRRKDPQTGQFPSRKELTLINQNIMQDAANNIKKYAPNSIVILVTNPLDAMCYVVKKVTGFSPQRIIGQAGALDTARYKTFIAQELNISVNDVHGIVLGGHGDSMVPLPKHTMVGGIPVTELIPEQRLNQIIERTANGGGEIVKLMGYSSFFAPAAGTAMIIESILLDQKRLIPCSVYTHGEYGFDDIFIGLPAVIGKDGAEKIVDISLSDQEQAMLNKSAQAVRDEIKLLN